MKKGNIIDLAFYRNQEKNKPREENDQNRISSELEIAIETLIQRLRENNPVQKCAK